MVDKSPTFLAPSRPKQRKNSIRHAEAISAYRDCDGWPPSEAKSSAGMMFDSLAQAWCMIRCPQCAARERDRKRRLELAEQGEAVPERTKCRERILATLEAGGMTGEDAAVLAYWLEILEDCGCPHCDGAGWVGPVRITEAMRTNPDITAFPTGSSNNGRAAPTVIMADPEAAEWERCGCVGNLLGKLRDLDPLCADALELYRAPGEIRLAALWPLTEAGRALMAAPSDPGGELREAADHQAADLLDRATCLWNELIADGARNAQARRNRAIRTRARALRGRGPR